MFNGKVALRVIVKKYVILDLNCLLNYKENEV